MGLRRLDDGSWPEAPLIVRPPDTLALGSVNFAVWVANLYRTAGLQM